jgi:ribosomal protein S18 acetylase RimI-like enzyme
MAVRHCPAVAVLHLNFLNTGFTGKPGLRLLDLYYRTVVEEVGACGYVAEQDDQVLGFVCGVWDSVGLRGRLLSRHWPSLALWGPAQVVIQPSLMRSLLGRLRQPPGATKAVDPGYELRPIVVDPAARGSGVARLLVRQLLEDAASRGFQTMHLYAEAHNKRAIAFYHKMGFQLSGSVQRPGGPHGRYERSVVFSV